MVEAIFVVFEFLFDSVLLSLCLVICFDYLVLVFDCLFDSFVCFRFLILCLILFLILGLKLF